MAAGTQWSALQQSIGLSHLALMDILIPVTVTKAGVPYNPTSDTLNFAFMPTPTQVPQLTDWVSGTWQTVTSNVLYPYNAVCLVGPGGTATPGIGSYVIYLKVTDNPEIPVLLGGQLQIS